jgi:hypothetical protein
VKLSRARHSTHPKGAYRRRLADETQENFFIYNNIFSQKFSIGVAELSIAPVVFFSGRLFFHDAKLLFCNQNPSQLIAKQDAFSDKFGVNSDSAARRRASRQESTYTWRRFLIVVPIR